MMDDINVDVCKSFSKGEKLREETAEYVVNCNWTMMTE